MIGYPNPSVSELTNLSKLPKDKVVLDYVLKKLSEQVSQQSYELFFELLTMYRTSVGFNPAALSKGRFKRIKSSEFKQLLSTVDQQLELILLSTEYRQLTAKQHDYESLFKMYLEISNRIKIYPANSMLHEVNSFEDFLQLQEAYSLLLFFYNEHQQFFIDIYSKEELENFIHQVKHLIKKQELQSEQIKLNLILKTLEVEFENGKDISQLAYDLFKELELLLTQENNYFTKQELVNRIIRCGKLLPDASRSLSNYVDHITEYLNSFIFYNNKQSEFYYSIIAKYNNRVIIEKRMEWIVCAEKLSKELDKDDVFAEYKIIKSIIAADQNDFIGSLKYLNEAEHQVHKMRGKNYLTRNTWVTISYYKALLYLNEYLHGSELYDSSHYDILIRIIEDSGTHQFQQSVLILEVSGLKSLANNDFKTALTYFQKSSNYRKRETISASKLISDYLTYLFTNKKSKLNSILKQLKDLNEPFLTPVGLSLLQGCALNFELKNVSEKNRSEQK